MSSKFQILYFFENARLMIAEIKRLDLPGNASYTETCHWLYFDKQTGALMKLWFHTMDSSGEIEERYFEQGFLKFNGTQATFIEKYNSAQHTLDRRSTKEASPELISVLESYFKHPEGKKD